MIKSIKLLPFSPFAIRPTFFLPGLVDLDFIPLEVVNWDVSLWPPWDPRITGRFRAELRNTGLLPLGDVTLEQTLNAVEREIFRDRSTFQGLSGSVTPEVSFEIRGLDFVRAILGVLFERQLPVRSVATASWLLFSKSFDIDANLPLS